jgi:hypothetical protein
LPAIARNVQRNGHSAACAAAWFAVPPEHEPEHFRPVKASDVADLYCAGFQERIDVENGRFRRASLGVTKLQEYIAYITCSTGQASATRAANLLDTSHDKVTRFLSQSGLSSSDIWASAKPLATEMAGDEGVLIVDDTLVAKPHRKANNFVGWYFDHTKNRTTKGINVLTLLYHGGGNSVPVSAEIIKKELVFDHKSNKEKYKSRVSKNELFRSMLATASKNVRFKYVLADSWFASAENMRAARAAGRHFVFALKSNRKAAVVEKSKQPVHFQRIDELDGLEPGRALEVWLNGFEEPVLLLKEVFKNGDGSTGERYLAASDVGLEAERASTIYQKRWKVEEFHRILKQVFSVGDSPAWSARAQSSHIYAAIIGVAKFERLKYRLKLNSYALNQKLYMVGLKAAYEELSALETDTYGRRGLAA